MSFPQPPNAAKWGRHIYLPALLVFLLAAPPLRAEKTVWPEGLIIAEGSESPNKEYGVLIPESESPDAPADFLANLRTHRKLGFIPGAEYFKHENHHDLLVKWAENSEWCLVDYEGRYGMAALTLVEPVGDGVTTTDLGQRLSKDLDASLTKSAHEKTGGEPILYLRLTKEGKARIRAVATTDPKSMSDHASYAFFQGTYDRVAKRWTVTDTRAVDGPQYDNLMSVFEDLNMDQMSFPSEADRVDWLDKRMNEVYQGVRAILPPEKFAAVKKEQIAWLKVRDASPSPAATGKLLQERIAELQKLGW